MQALSFTAHIPLVCFGIAFPVMVLLMGWWGQRTSDPLCRTIARRWSRVMIALFTIGAITGTVLSFEMGVLWPNFTATFGGVFGLGFAIEGFSFFLEAIFLGIYVYGWDRLSPRMHLLSGADDAEPDPATIGDVIGLDDAEYERAEARTTIERLTSILDPRARDVLRMRFQHGLRQWEIAAAIGCSQRQVSRIIRTSLERLSAHASTACGGSSMSDATEGVTA